MRHCDLCLCDLVTVYLRFRASDLDNDPAARHESHDPISLRSLRSRLSSLSGVPARGTVTAGPALVTELLPLSLYILGHPLAYVADIQLPFHVDIGP